VKVAFTMWAYETPNKSSRTPMPAEVSEGRGVLLGESRCRKLGFMGEIVFEVTQEADGGYVAECLTEGIFTQADGWEELRRNVREAVAAFYFDRAERPSRIRLHFVRDEVLA
jgi:predicted RNase H-like HicB family nuclease